jgi:6-pyruvoyltetrahydropterin/6-carboxytetrahydropterin synthase
MSFIRIQKIFRFEMAHALYGYDGPCKNIHGHSYTLKVVLIGKPNTIKNHPKLGMVMDFGELKKIVEKEILHEFDHALVLNLHSPHKKIENKLFEKIVWAKYQPTCENLIIDFANRLKKKLPKDIKLHHLELQETATSSAQWFANDN